MDPENGLDLEGLLDWWILYGTACLPAGHGLKLQHIELREYMKSIMKAKIAIERFLHLDLLLSLPSPAVSF